MTRNLLFFCLSLLVVLGSKFESYSQCNPGIMSPGPVFICNEETGIAAAANLVTDGSCTSGYFLLDNTSGVTTNPIASNASGIFDITGAEINIPYYVFSAVGTDVDGDGLPDTNDPNLELSSTFTEVVFLDDITIEATQVCDQATGMSVVTLEIDGGFSGFDESELEIEILGAIGPVISGTTEGGVFTFNLPPNSDVFDIVCSDQKLCTATLEFNPEPCLFDLALIKELAAGQPATVMPGDDVTFTITIENQGSFSVMGIDIVDYIPSGFVLNDPNWTASGNTATTVIEGPLDNGASTTVDITLTVVPGTDAGSYDNLAEIVNFEDLAGNPGDDLDSTPDNDPSNDTLVDNVTDNSMGDEDDHDIATVAVNVPTFDLALTKTLAAGQSPTIAPGDNVTFTITVYNQGEATAQNIVVADYIPAGLTLNDANWTQMGTTATTTIAGPIAPGSSAAVNITFSVPNTAASSTETNFAEIASADDMFGNPGVDVDSTPDMNNSNDGAPTDDAINGENGDEDDHDLAVIEIVDPVFDLALTKVLASSGPYEPGDQVSFTITVYNQGQEAAQNIVITDYIPAGLTLADAGWTLAADGTSATTTIVGPVAPGSQASVNISFTINADVQSGPITNLAEISSAQDPFGNTATDVDSTADSDPNNDGTCVDDAINNENGDEDDHDCATFNVEACTSTATMPTNAIWVCAGESGGSGAATLDLNPGHVVCYILHDSPTSELGVIYDQNTSGLFSQPASLPGNSALYISAIVGPPGAGGCPDPATACEITAGTQIIFLLPVTINVTLECLDKGYQALVTVTGGSQAFEPLQGPATISGTVSGAQDVNVETVYGPFVDGESFSITAVDSKGCVGTFTSGAPECGCRNEAGTMAPGPLVGCAGTTLTSTQSGSVLAQNDVAIYALHDSGTDQAGNILAVSADGSFSDPGTSTCQQLYISYVFGPDDGTGAPDLTSECTIVLPGTPVLWTPEISIVGVEICDNSTGTFSVNYTISGGYPECDPSATYNVTGDNLMSGIGAGTYPISGEFTDGDSYTVTVVDQYGCSDTFDSGEVQCTKLPVSLIALNGVAIRDGNLIRWTTASEIENDYFTLYRTNDNGDFVKIANIKGNGTTSNMNSYEFLDRNAPSGVSTYKLQQTDFDGTVHDVDMVEVQRGESTILSINSILPIPVISELQVSYQAVAGITEIKIYDMVGRSIYENNTESIDGLNFQSIEFDNENSGIYFITLINNNKVATKRFVKE